jgi:hypothetical protein
VTDPDLIGLFIEPLEAKRIRYMITGGVASVIYGDPRFTRDVDVVMQLSAAEIADLASAFDAAAFYVPPAEAVAQEITRTEGGHFNVIHRDTSLRADVYLAGADPLIEWAFDRRVRLQVGNAEIWVAPIEYVILRKLDYYEHSDSDRHLRDVAMMLRISGETVDSESLQKWAEHLDLQDTLARSRRFSPD